MKKTVFTIDTNQNSIFFSAVKLAILFIAISLLKPVSTVSATSCSCEERRNPQGGIDCIEVCCDTGQTGTELCWNNGSCTCGAGPGCFLPGTQIATGEGETQSIENLKTGDRVVGFDEQTGEVSQTQVFQVHEVQRDYYYEIETASGDKVQVTAEHPFFVGFDNTQTGNFLTQLFVLLTNSLANPRS